MAAPPGIDMPPPYEQWLVAVLPQFEQRFGMHQAVQMAEAYYQKKYLGPIEAYNLGFAAAQAQAAAAALLVGPVDAAFPPAPPAVSLGPAVQLDDRLLASIPTLDASSAAGPPAAVSLACDSQRQAEPTSGPEVRPRYHGGGAGLPQDGGWASSGGTSADSSWKDDSAWHSGPSGSADAAWQASGSADPAWQGSDWKESDSAWHKTSSWDKDDTWSEGSRKRWSEHADQWQERKKQKVVHRDDPDYVKHCSAKAVEWYTAKNRTGWLNKITPLVYHTLKGHDKDWEIAVNVAKAYSDDKQVEQLIHLYRRHLKD